MKFLLDANLSPETAEFLRRHFSFDAVSIFEIQQTHLADPGVVGLAKQESRIVITHDLDFGTLFYDNDLSFGAIILRLHDQRIESVNAVLENFFANNLGQKIFQANTHALVVIDETSVRVAEG